MVIVGRDGTRYLCSSVGIAYVLLQDLRGAL